MERLISLRIQLTYIALVDKIQSEAREAVAGPEGVQAARTGTLAVERL